MIARLKAIGWIVLIVFSEIFVSPFVERGR
jgi:hypothetical protein